MTPGTRVNRSTPGSCITERYMVEWTTMNTTRLLESGTARGTGKRWRAKLIAADVWGSSAFYPAEVLARDASTAFPAGTKMFENHLTESETWERPVGDVAKLVGKLATPGEYEADNPEGPGVYADVEFYDSYVDRIREIGSDVGLSVDGGADYVEGERDGRFGKIVTGIPYIKSVDVVVAAGAGGKLISIRESTGPMAGTPINNEGDQSVTALTKDEFTEGLKGLAETLTTAIKESLAPVFEAPKVEDVEPTPAPVVEAPEESEDEAKPDEDEANDVEVNLAEVATKFVEAGLPPEVMPSVVTAVQEGKTVDEAIKAQTAIREAFLAQTNSASVRIVESDRGNEGPSLSLREKILAATK